MMKLISVLVILCSTSLVFAQMDVFSESNQTRIEASLKLLQKEYEKSDNGGLTMSVYPSDFKDFQSEGLHPESVDYAFYGEDHCLCQVNFVDFGASAAVKVSFKIPPSSKALYDHCVLSSKGKLSLSTLGELNPETPAFKLLKKSILDSQRSSGKDLKTSRPSPKNSDSKAISQ